MTRVFHWIVFLLSWLGMMGCPGPEAPPPDGGGAFDAFAGLDATTDARLLRDASTDAFYAPPDAFRVPVEVLYLNPTSPDCLDRTMPPRWSAENGEQPEGTILWSVSLRERRFAAWVAAQRGLTDPWWIRAAPSLTGSGIANWYSYNDASRTTWAIGLQGPGGVFANSGMVDLYGHSRIWLPRHDMLLSGSANGGWRMYAPPADREYPPSSSEDFSVTIVRAPGSALWEGAMLTRGPEGDMPAWSPVTGDLLSFGALHDMSGERYRGVGAFCEEGTRWFTQLPIYQGGSSVYVRPDGDVVVASRDEAWVLDGETGELLRTATFVGERGVPGSPSAYQPGCGLLFQSFVESTWRWRWWNDDTTELGPPLELPEDRVTNIGLWTGTPDCGLAALGSRTSESLYFTRLEADGSVRYSVVFRGPDEGRSIGAPPVPLSDGGTLLITTPLGWVRYSSTGEELSDVVLDFAATGGGPAVPPTVAPDGTLYGLGVSGFGEYRFFAAATGVTPGPFLWPNSGSNWARTNSVLPE